MHVCERDRDTLRQKGRNRETELGRGKEGEEEEEKWLIWLRKIAEHLFFFQFLYIFSPSFPHHLDLLVYHILVECIFQLSSSPPKESWLANGKQKIEWVEKKFIPCLRNKGTKGISLCVEQTILEVWHLLTILQFLGFLLFLFIYLFFEFNLE